MSDTCPICNLATSTQPPGSLCPACADLLHWIREYYADVPDVRIEPDTHFYYDLALDSLDYVDWVLESQARFNIRIPNRDADRLHTVGEFIAYLRRHGAVWRPDQFIRIVHKGRWFTRTEFRTVENPPPPAGPAHPRDE